MRGRHLFLDGCQNLDNAPRRWFACWGHAPLEDFDSCWRLDFVGTPIVGCFGLLAVAISKSAVDSHSGKQLCKQECLKELAAVRFLPQGGENPPFGRSVEFPETSRRKKQPFLPTPPTGF